MTVLCGFRAAYKRVCTRVLHKMEDLPLYAVACLLCSICVLDVIDCLFGTPFWRGRWAIVTLALGSYVITSGIGPETVLFRIGRIFWFIWCAWFLFTKK